MGTGLGEQAWMQIAHDRRPANMVEGPNAIDGNDDGVRICICDCAQAYAKRMGTRPCTQCDLER